LEPLVDVLKLLIGGLLLYYGAEWLVKGSAGLARSFGVKPLVVGLTVVAYGTSAPELAVSSAAILDGSSGVVLGNIFGSCVANLALILGITAVIAPPSVDGRLIRREVPVLLISAIAPPLILLDGVVAVWEAVLLVIAAVAFTIFTLFVSAKDTGESSDDDDEDEFQPGQGETKLRLGLITLVGLAMLVGGGDFFVDGARGIAKFFGMSDPLIGATVVAIGTSLPELAASIVAATRGYSSLAVGNVVGSNIFNVFLIMGAVGLIRPIYGTFAEYKAQLLFLVGVTVLGILFMRGTRRISRAEGILLLAAYAGFIAMLIVDAVG